MSATAPAFPFDETLTEGVMLRRVIAYLIDLVLLAALCLAIWAVLFTFGVLTLGLGFPLLSLLPVVPFAYHFLSLLSQASATPGQILLGLTVRRNDDLGPPRPLQAALSVAGFYVTLAFGAVWLATALITVRRRALHDLLSGLVVVRKEALTGRYSPWHMSGGGFPAA
jgi:uncharacterized RDD family membrane protein YckC